MKLRVLIGLSAVATVTVCYLMAFTFLAQPTLRRLKFAIVSCSVLMVIFYMGMFYDPRNADSEIGTFACRFILFPSTVALLCLVIRRAVRPWKKQCK
jgi:multisubunit Na+/H+ antiporter MnhB subunit